MMDHTIYCLMVHNCTVSSAQAQKVGVCLTRDPSQGPWNVSKRKWVRPSERTTNSEWIDVKYSTKTKTCRQVAGFENPLLCIEKCMYANSCNLFCTEKLTGNKTLAAGTHFCQNLKINPHRTFSLQMHLLHPEIPRNSEKN